MSMRQALVNVGEYFFYKTLEKELTNCQSVLDVGCGNSSPLGKVKKTFHSVGVDVYKPNIDESKKTGIHDRYKLGDVLAIDAFFKPKSFDAVIALDIIEHLGKRDGWKLIEKMENIAKKKVLILTPYGFTQQHPYDGNPYQKHKSGWYISDFTKQGYNVYGMRGFRFIRGEFATIKYRPWFLWGTFSVLSEYLVFFMPKLAYQLLAVKRID